MVPEIIATLEDFEYGKKYQEGKFISVSKWSWGVDKEKRLYCRDYNKDSIIDQWLPTDQLQLFFDLDTIHKISRWSKSVDLKIKLETIYDRS